MGPDNFTFRDPCPFSFVTLRLQVWPTRYSYDFSSPSTSSPLPLPLTQFTVPKIIYTLLDLPSRYRFHVHRVHFHCCDRTFDTKLTKRVVSRSLLWLSRDEEVLLVVSVEVLSSFPCLPSGRDVSRKRHTRDQRDSYVIRWVGRGDSR